MINDPGTLQVTCDECGEEQDMETTEYAGGEGPTWGVDESTIKQYEWTTDGSEHKCPECK